ncbi:MAG: cobaltochelatase subunit CobN [Bacteroidales bacterium]|nr:cobaltochelatase subunit CobN [Bacteroidales bacterium]
MKKKNLLIGGSIAVVALIAFVVWHVFASTTKVGFINYQVIALGHISKANTNSSIKIEEVSTDEFDKLNDYDMIFINAMGLRITEDQRAVIKKAADNGLPVLTTAITNPMNNICSVDSVAADSLRKYLSNGGRRNYRSLLNYVRKDIDKKIFNIAEPEMVVEAANDMIYHIDPKKPEEDPLGFNTIADYHKFLKENNLWKENAPGIVVTGQMGEPTDLIAKLEETGNVVYPIRSMRKFVCKHHIDSIKASAVINMAHGRMGDYMVDYLTKQNIPLFSPLNVNRLVDKWENDPMGMNGGFLSQSVVTPEIDGALRPFVLFGHRLDEDGMQESYTIPERLETFVKSVNNYISLKHKPNSEKRVAIYYYKGPGQNALAAAGMEVVPSLYNLLVRMKEEGYRVDNLPKSHKELGEMIQAQGAVFNAYAEGAFTKFMKNGKPELITKEQYEGWVKATIRPEKYAEVVALNGEFPGQYMTTEDGRLGVARLKFGNVVVLPQNAAGAGSNSFKIVHGTNAAPPHTYIASYLWTQFGFKADAIIHFGTHGSLEFTPKKQVALCQKDWPDRLVGALPHFYIYSIGNVGEGIIAKRRSYAGLQSYLTPPFMESNVRGIYRELNEAIKNYNNLLGEGNHTQATLDKASLKVKEYTMKMGIHRELELDSIKGKPYAEDEVARIESFAEELANEKVTGQLYTMGIPYEDIRIQSSVYAMSVEPIAYSVLALDKLNGKAAPQVEKHRSIFTARYLNPARALVTRLLASPHSCNDEMVMQTAHITKEELEEARKIDKSRSNPDGMMAMMMAAAEESEDGKSGMMGGMKGMTDSKANTAKAGNKNTAKKGGMAAMMKKKMMKKKEYTKEQITKATAIMEVERAIKNVHNYRKALKESPEIELASIINGMNGGYTKPSPGGDPIANPNTLPTGRNLYSINAEATPSEAAWEKGIRLANNTINLYKKRHNDSIPRKVSYTLWSGEFIETEGATIAQILYMLGVEPIRDAFGRVSDIRLIPSKELGRPRIDVVVQTSGQLRDLAASRLFLINRAVEMAAAAKNDEFENMVSAGVVEAERTLIEKGLTPKDAREMASFRVFGGMNGGYGTGIQGMVEAGDRWESEKEIADTYLNNMGAYYGSEKNWEVFKQFAFEAALTRTDAVIQPRQSNTWGALSLDHVYEFMGGMNLAVRNVTGKDPDAYLSDYRNRNNVRMQEVKEAIGVESRTTIFNPNYIREKMKGEASAAGGFAEIVRNTYGWNVMKPKAIDKEMWDEIYNVYVKDKFNLGVKEFFENQNPAALQEMTAVMMETARKGMWKASREQLKEIAKLHTELVNKYNAGCSGFVCDNAKLRDFIAQNTDAQSAQAYKEKIQDVREKVTEKADKGMVMKKQEMSISESEEYTNLLNNTMVAVAVIIVFAVIVIVIRRKRKQQQEE